MSVYELNHHPADLPATITAAEAGRELVAQTLDGRGIKISEHAHEIMQEDVTVFAGRQRAHSVRRFLEDAIAIGVVSHGRV